MALKWLLNFAFGYLVDNGSANGQVSSPGDEEEHMKEVTPQMETTASKGKSITGFQMPLHYPRYTKRDYESMEEWKVDVLLTGYGLTFNGSLDEKRAFAMGAFLWPDQL
ncbi:hypothetical protein RJ641_034739 [Dillenia turbinata]|uniref:DUF7722 domain-containing protein n=1 Tax=Dillenia turbinata TaxID=194707 RepID=A0AAN8VJ39_9MAGN